MNIMNQCALLTAAEPHSKRVQLSLWVSTVTPFLLLATQFFQQTWLPPCNCLDDRCSVFMLPNVIATESW